MQVFPMQIRVCGPKRGNILVDFNVYVTISEVDVSIHGGMVSISHYGMDFFLNLGDCNLIKHYIFSSLYLF